MSRGKKISLFLLFFIYLMMLIALPLRYRLRAAAEAVSAWRLSGAEFPFAAAAACAGIALAIFVLTCVFYYIFAESKKFFPLVPRAMLWLALTAAAATELTRALAPQLARLAPGLTDAAVSRLTLAAPAAATAVAALFMLESARRAVVRSASAINKLAEGNSDVRVKRETGDETQSLALAVNSFARTYAKDTRGAQRRDESYMKFIPQRLVSLMGVNGIEEVDRNTAFVRNMSVLVVRFSFAEDARGGGAAELFAKINEIITRGTAFVHKNGGAVYSFYHNGYDAVFSGTPSDAVSAVVAIRQDILAFNRERSESGSAPISLYAAVDKGEVIMGVIGDDDRLAPAAVSACIDGARYLAELAERLGTGILCTTEIAQGTEAYAQRYLGKCHGRNIKAGSIRVYEIFDGDALETHMAKEKTRTQFAEGVYLLYARDFSGAKKIFMDIVRLNAADGASRFYLFLADGLEKNGVTDEAALYLNRRENRRP